MLLGNLDPAAMLPTGVIYSINKYYILLSDRPGRVLEQQLVMEPRTTRAKRQHPIPQNTAPETPETVSERILWFLRLVNQV